LIATQTPPSESIVSPSGRPLPGIDLWLEDGELVTDPRTVPTFFSGYLGEEPAPQEHVKIETAPYKYPRQLEFVDSLPKTPSGKIRRAELRRD
jgi:acyl-CoA synthetase (AMP-forming)/AMP-acid ligase II